MEVEAWRPSLGAWPIGPGHGFRLWAPKARSVEVVVERNGTELLTRALARSPDGTFAGFVEGVRGGRPLSLPHGRRGAVPRPGLAVPARGRPRPVGGGGPGPVSLVGRGLEGPRPEELVIYELHVGTFSPEGTFAGVAERLEYAARPGRDGDRADAGGRLRRATGAGATTASTCSPRRAATARPTTSGGWWTRPTGSGLGVILDVVYNHFGPVGNYAYAFSDQYLSDRESAWAACVNLDGEGSERVREFFIENALHWLHEYHIDGLRLDATHALHDESRPTSSKCWPRGCTRSSPAGGCR